MNSINIIGTLGQDCEVRFTSSGTAVVNGTFAYNRRYGDKEQTFWFDYRIWGKGAETFAKFHRKGSTAVFSGRLTQDTWKNKEGENRSKVVIDVESWTFAKGNNKNDGYAKKEEQIGAPEDNFGFDEAMTDTPF